MNNPNTTQGIDLDDERAKLPLVGHPEPRVMAWTALEENAIRMAQYAAFDAGREFALARQQTPVTGKMGEPCHECGGTLALFCERCEGSGTEPRKPAAAPEAPTQPDVIHVPRLVLERAAMLIREDMPQSETLKQIQDLLAAPATHQATLAAPAESNVAWAHELQKRVMMADDQGDDDLHNLLGEVACCLAALTGWPDTPLSPAYPPKPAASQQAMVDCGDCEGSGRISPSQLCARCNESGILPAATTASASTIKPWNERLNAEGLYEEGVRLFGGWTAVTMARDAEIAELRAAQASHAGAVSDTHRLDWLITNTNACIVFASTGWTVWDIVTGQTFAAKHETARGAIDEAIATTEQQEKVAPPTRGTGSQPDAEFAAKRAELLRADLSTLQSFVNDLDDGSASRAFYNIRAAIITQLHAEESARRCCAQRTNNDNKE